MAVYRDFSAAAYVYLGLHGTYGWTWMIKHFAFPNHGFECKITFPAVVRQEASLQLLDYPRTFFRGKPECGH